MVLGFRPPVFILLLLISLTLLGCRQQPQITSYKAPKEEIVALESTRQRMLGAILPAQDTCWFFKLTEDPEVVAKVAKDFHTFATSARVTGGEPEWTLLEGWKEKPGDQFRYRTIQIPVDGKTLELSVSKLPLNEELDPYLLKNVNRWRGQLGLPAIDESELPKMLNKVDREGQSPVYLCELEGTKTGGGMGMPPFASGAPFANSSHAAGSSADGASNGAEPEVKVTAPPEWQPGRPSPISIAAYVVSEGNQTAEITVTSARGSELANVQRWGGQLNLDQITAEQFAQEKKTLDVAGKPVSYFVMHGTDENQQPESILGVIIPRDRDSSWFVKMKGDTQLVSREQQRFEQFVRDIQFQ
jgi:hypothetical protein